MIGMSQSLTIAEVAAETGLSAHALRYYEKAGLMRETPPRGGNGHRRYTERDLAWIRFLTRLRGTGMSIADVRRYAELVRAGESTAAERKQILLTHREEVAKRISRLKDDLAAIDYKIEIYEKLEEKYQL